MREGTRKEVRSEIAKEVGIANGGVRDGRGIVQRHSDLVRLDELEHSSEKQTLKLESTFVISVSEHEKDILHDVEEVLLEEGIRDRGICTSKVVDDFKTNYKAVINTRANVV